MHILDIRNYRRQIIKHTMNKKKAKKDSMKKKSDEQQTESSSSSSCAVENDLFDYFEAQEFQIDETKESVEMKSQLRRIIKRRNKIYYRVQKKMNVIKNLTLCTNLVINLLRILNFFFFFNFDLTILNLLVGRKLVKCRKIYQSRRSLYINNRFIK